MRVVVSRFAGAAQPDWEAVAPGRCELRLWTGLVSLTGRWGSVGERRLPSPGPWPAAAEQMAWREAAGGDWQLGARQSGAGREGEILGGGSRSAEVEYVLMLG